MPRRCPVLGYTLPLLLLLPLAAGCRNSPPTTAGAGEEAVQRLCRERLADLPPGTSARWMRRHYLACLQRGGEPAAPSPPPAAPIPQASAQERYLHCRLHSAAIAAAYDAYSRSSAAWSEADSLYADDDPRRIGAQRAYLQAVAEVERLIPPAMRGNLPLLPDALLLFRRCEPDSFR